MDNCMDLEACQSPEIRPSLCKYVILDFFRTDLGSPSLLVLWAFIASVSKIMVPVDCCHSLRSHPLRSLTAVTSVGVAYETKNSRAITSCGRNAPANYDRHHDRHHDEDDGSVL